jgi:hypothetical protein
VELPSLFVCYLPAWHPASRPFSHARLSNEGYAVLEITLQCRGRLSICTHLIVQLPCCGHALTKPTQRCAHFQTPRDRRLVEQRGRRAPIVI